MRITERSPQRLVLKDQSIWITVLCFAAAAFLAGYAIFRMSTSNGLWLTAILFAIFGLIFLRSAVVEFDKVTGLCTVSKFSAIKRTHLSIPFANIETVRIEIESLNASSQRERYRLSIVTSSSVIPLSNSYEPGSMYLDEIHAAILEILSGRKVPPPDPVRSLVEEGRIVDAVALLRQRDNLDITTARQRVAEIQKATNRD